MSNMKKLSQKILNDLFEQLDSLSITAKPKEILTTLLEWLRLNAEILNEKPFIDDGLNESLNLNPDIYPVEHSPLHGAEFIHFKNTIKKYTYKDKEPISMFLRQALDSLFLLEVDVYCPNCESSGFFVWKSETYNELVYECKQCAINYFINDFTKNNFTLVENFNVVPATKIDLKAAYLI